MRPLKIGIRGLLSAETAQGAVMPNSYGFTPDFRSWTVLKLQYRIKNRRYNYDSERNITVNLVSWNSRFENNRMYLLQGKTVVHCDSIAERLYQQNFVRCTLTVSTTNSYLLQFSPFHIAVQSCACNWISLIINRRLPNYCFWTPYRFSDGTVNSIETFFGVPRVLCIRQSCRIFLRTVTNCWIKIAVRRRIEECPYI